VETLEPGEQPFHLVDQRQQRIYKRLGTLIGHGAAQYYFDACRLMSEPQGLATRSHVVAHILREVESMIRQSLMPPISSGDAKDGGKTVTCPCCGEPYETGTESNHCRQIEYIVETYQWNGPNAATSGWIDRWKETAQRNKQTSPARWAHRHNLDAPRPSDARFEYFVEHMELVFDEILHRLEITYHDVVGPRMEKLLKHDPQQGAKILKNRLPNSPAVIKTFFSRLDDPRWLKPLAKGGYFSSPPQPTAHDGVVLVPRWPQADYLKRMASTPSPDVQDTVGEILAEIAPGENVYLRVDLIDIALALRPSNALGWVKRETERINLETHLDRWPSHNLVAIVPHLAQGEQEEAALALAFALLAVFPAMDEQTRRWGDDLTIRVDEHDYDELLRQVVDMAGRQKAGVAAFRGLCKLLDQVLRIVHRSSDNARAEMIDGSGRHIESIGGPPTRIQDTEDKLIWAVRDAAETVIKVEALSVAHVVKELEGYNWKAFRRLVLHVATSFPDPSLSTRLLTNRASFDYFSQEYQQLLECHFGSLPPEAQAIILGWIDAGPDVEAYKSGWQRTLGRTVTDAEAREFADDWRCQRLLSVQEWLPPDHLQQLERLKERVEPARRKEQESLKRPKVQPPPDPRTADIDDIVVFLRKNTDEDFLTASGFHNQLAVAVTADPERFARSATSFLDSTPSGLWHVLHGFHEAAKAKPSFPWEPVLELCDEALQITAKRHDDCGSEARTTWADVRGRVASMVNDMMHWHSKHVPFSCRKQVWKLIQELASDPPPDDEGTDYGSYADLAMASLGNTCGLALHAAVGYAVWVKSSVGEHWQGFASAPEIKELLEKHLACTSRAIRAVYGGNYSRLAHLDLQWARQNAAQLFPASRGHTDPMFQAAWLPYIACSRPRSVLLDILRPQYALALEVVSDYDSVRSGVENPHKSLADQLMWLYLTGAIGMEDGGFVNRLFIYAPDGLRASALRWIGRVLADGDELGGEVIQRVQDLWEWRLGEAHRLDRPAELREFGYWFASGKLPEEWALEQLREVLEYACPANAAHRVTERLADLAPRFPLSAMRCLSLLLKDRAAAQGLARSRHTRAILKQALASGDASAAHSAEEEINRLFVDCLADHTDLLREDPN